MLSDVIGASSDALAERVANEIGDMVIRERFAPASELSSGVSAKFSEFLGRRRVRR